VMAAARKKGKKKIPAVVLIGGAVGLLVLVLYMADSKNKKKAAAAATSSNAVQGVGYPAGAGMVEEPNSYAATPTIQNYAVTSSTATPSHVHFHQKAKTQNPVSAPTAPTAPAPVSSPPTNTAIVTATGKESMAAIARAAGLTENQLLSLNPSNESIIRKFWGTGKPVPKGSVWHT
jgi:hypothetical protein